VKLKTRLEQRDGQTVFVINRKEWMRGDGNSSMWSELTGSGCCLGLAALCEGVSRNAIIGKGGPVSARSAGVVFPPAYAAAWLGTVVNYLRAEAITTNDTPDLSAPERERRIKAVFRHARGWLVEFED
jgi:hypothetical protein